MTNIASGSQTVAPPRRVMRQTGLVGVQRGRKGPRTTAPDAAAARRRRGGQEVVDRPAGDLVEVDECHGQSWAEARSLRQFWFPFDTRAARVDAVVHAPAAFRRRGVYVSAQELTVA